MCASTIGYLGLYSIKNIIRVLYLITKTWILDQIKLTPMDKDSYFLHPNPLSSFGN